MLAAFGLIATASAAWAKLLNVSYDVTRDSTKPINPQNK